MKNLIIMAAGASSRMKKSLDQVNLSSDVRQVAISQHKSLIPFDKTGKSLLFYLCTNAKKAGYESIYLLTSINNKPFYDWVKKYNSTSELNEVKFYIAVQKTPPSRTKPFGTADGIQQVLDQFPKLLTERFTVCNGDNLYSISVLRTLLNHENSSHAIIAYDRSFLKFPEERITKFALMVLGEDDYLEDIVEKPPVETHDSFRNEKNELFVSMNIFNFNGSTIYKYLESCPLNPERDEKELPEAVRMILKKEKKSVFTYIAREHLKDLTYAQDISDF